MGINEAIIGEYQSHLFGDERANISMLSEGRVVFLGLGMSGGPDPQKKVLEKSRLRAQMRPEMAGCEAGCKLQPNCTQFH